MSDADGRRGDDERREHFRVKDEALVTYRAVDAAEGERIRADAGLAWPNAFSLCSRLHEMRQDTTVLRRHAERESSTFGRLVDQLDRKLDLVTEVLLAQEVTARGAQVLPVDVSAEGIGFTVSRSLPAEQLVETRLVFRSTGLGLRTLGRVVYCQSDLHGGFCLGLTFEFLRDYDRELMVYHVLQRQSMLLRGGQYGS